jgi:DNA-binding NarL/FixJ family response regulator
VNQEVQENRIRLLLLDDQALFRASLGRLLASQPGLEVVGECGNSAEALEILNASSVNVVLLDFDGASEGADGFMSAARRKGYQGRFLILAATADARNSEAAIKCGASGIFLKSEPPDRLVQAIALVANGAVWLDQKMIRMLADQPVDRFRQADQRGSADPLTEREQKVLLGILGGLTNQKIGHNLGISVGSVKASVQQLFDKAGVRTRSRLVRAALEGSLVAAATSIRHDAPRQPAAYRLSPQRQPNS